ncbi:prepilin-type N-terminal cleavage/methylation domain-containing protein [Lyngbya sp. CCY1209]|uniref:prepilin-type N-terminal cleavage/methylation domain-containing protein n=1 Tax=Lyngbya sp. CCY1209 TaxID=2886103 RepID=UPI002D202974|nr:prepilin-type N-terminal cleavage/methylation domain-containing protein [Lyngbya sp. CCY1209]MEB3887221.1 prepilin-type N-terminal cleavage/methylation domain-containing protein [Lyngbya sp. CCY1209]
MLSLIQSFLNRRHRRNPPQLPRRDGGFTMIELIVGMVITFLIITPLLGFVVSILNDDRNEGEKAAMEQELQAALDFITADLSQAFYIYKDGQFEEAIEDENGEIQIIDLTPLLEIDGRMPILVFWMKHTLPNSLPPITEIDTLTPKDCDEPDEPCDDSSVNALVAYYLVPGEKDEIWCPHGEPCPSRIERYLIRGPLEKAKGTGLIYDPSELKDSQQASDAFNPDFDVSVLLGGNQTDAARNVVIQTPSDGEVLINYIDIDGFNLDRVGDDNDSAKITIRGNAMSRIQATETDYCTKDENNDDLPDNTSFCPQVTIEVKGLRLQN